MASLPGYVGREDGIAVPGSTFNASLADLLVVRERWLCGVGNAVLCFTGAVSVICNLPPTGTEQRSKCSFKST